MTTYIGIDPGMDGYVAAIFVNGTIETFPTPTVRLSKKNNKRGYDVSGMRRTLFDIWISQDLSLACLEKQQAMPGQGVASTFKIGYGFGIWQGILSGLLLPHKIVHPKTWQKVMLRDIMGSDTKARSIMAAGAMFPTVDLKRTERCRKADNNKTDALLMAAYAKTVLAGEGGRP